MIIDPLYLIFLAPAMLLMGWAQHRIKSAYADGMQVRAPLSGAAAARHILDVSGLEDVPIEIAPGQLVVPGIRGVEEERDDQARTATAASAALAGATHLVVGRPILRAADPAGALRRLTEAAAVAPTPAGEA